MAETWLEKIHERTVQGSFVDYMIQHHLYRDDDDQIIVRQLVLGAGKYLMENTSIAEIVCIGRHIDPSAIVDGEIYTKYGLGLIDQKWYGWNHRGIRGFEAGDTIEEGDELVDDSKDIPAGHEVANEADAIRIAKIYADLYGGQS